MATKNLIDDTSTTVTPATPGVQLNLTYRTTMGRAARGVPVRFWAYTSGTVTNDTGTVQILDAAGAAMLTVPVNTTTEMWRAVDGWLPATDAKYDQHYGGNTLGTLKVYDTALEQFADISPLEGALAATISPFTLVATGLVVTNSFATVTKNIAGDGWDAGASSNQSAAGDAYVQVAATAGNDRALGFVTSNSLNHGNTDSILGTNFAVYMAPSNELKVAESGSFPFTGGTWANGDILAVRRIGTAITYLKNGTVFYTSGSTSSGTIYVTGDLNDGSSALSNVALHVAGTPTALTWTGNSNVTIT